LVALTCLLSSTLVGTAHAASFVDPTRLSIAATPPTTAPGSGEVTISGKLKADHAFCRNGSKVTLRAFGESRGEPFPGGPIDTARTAPGGTYEFTVEVTEQVRFRVWFTGRVGGVHPDIKTCRKSRSATVTVGAG
jgi:hypothetical protein